MAESEQGSAEQTQERRRIGGLVGAAALGFFGVIAIGVAATGLSTMVIGMSPIAAASSRAATPALPPGFCVAPAALEPFAGEQTLVAFVSCRELAQWRDGARTRFDMAGAVMTRPASDGAEIIAPAAGAPSLLVELSSATDAATVTRLMALAAKMTAEHVAAADLGAAIDGEVEFRATLIRQPPDGLRIRMSAEAAESGGAPTRRELVMPFEGGDTLRYMRALLRAGLAADHITHMAAAE